MDPERPPDPHRREITGVDEPVHRHVGHPQHGGHLADREEPRLRIIWLVNRWTPLPRGGLYAKPGAGESARGVKAPGRVAREPGRADQRPIWRDRSVAEATASRKAERTARASRARSPAAVVPPGEVTAARSCSGSSPGLLEHAGRTDEGLDNQRPAHSRGKPDSTPASMSASATKNT